MTSFNPPEFTRRPSNVHPVIPDLTVHTVISSDLDCDHAAAMELPLGEVSDEQLIAEFARRKLDVRQRITDSLVKETYTFGEVLGRGASATVYKVSHNITCGSFACKVVEQDPKMNDAKSMSTEIEIMKRIRHKNILSMYELFESPRCLWIIMELADGGDLFHYIANAKVYNEAIIAQLMQQILSGVHYLHAMGVVHRDLRPDNILLSGTLESCDVKIADFGLSALVRIGEKGYDTSGSEKRKRYAQLTEKWGTKEYFAPEVLEQMYGPQVDVWALGCVFYELLCGELTFPVRSHDTLHTFYGRIARASYDMRKPVIVNKISPDAKKLLQSMLHVDPIERLSASQCLTHPWMTEGLAAATALGKLSARSSSSRRNPTAAAPTPTKGSTANGGSSSSSSEAGGAGCSGGGGVSWWWPSKAIAAMVTPAEGGDCNSSQQQQQSSEPMQISSNESTVSEQQSDNGSNLECIPVQYRKFTIPLPEAQEKVRYRIELKKEKDRQKDKQRAAAAAANAAAAAATTASLL